jgi:Na+/melibiose symporter-like transporter
VAPSVLTNLALTYAPIYLGLYIIGLTLLMGYRITRASHAETLSLLAAKAEAVAGDPSQRLA